jgi:hypothetical protein
MPTPQRARHVVGRPVAQCQSVEHGSALASPPGTPAAGRGGSLYLAMV